MLTSSKVNVKEKITQYNSRCRVRVSSQPEGGGLLGRALSSSPSDDRASASGSQSSIYNHSIISSMSDVSFTSNATMRPAIDGFSSDGDDDNDDDDDELILEVGSFCILHISILHLTIIHTFVYNHIILRT